MTHLVVCTHCRHDLARGAVASVRKNASDDLRVTVLDSSGTLEAWGGVEVMHVDVPRYHHAGVARRISRDGELTVCIDDDMRLVERVNLVERYPAGWFKHLNGHMLMAWWGPGVTTPYTRLSQWRTSSRCVLADSVLCEYAAATNAEQIDLVWLHIDKGSTTPTAERDALIAYIDRGPGLGDYMAKGLAAVGITKERVQAVAQAAGVKDCGCSGRQQKANELGRRIGIG